MSYRTIKRVLGETSLERKCRFLFGTCLLLLITGSFWWYGNQTEQLVKKQDPISGHLLVDTILILHHYNEITPDDDPFKPYGMEMEGNLHNQQFDWSFLVPYSSTEPRKVAPVGEFETRVLEQFLAERPDVSQEEAEQAKLAGQSLPEETAPDEAPLDFGESSPDKAEAPLKYMDHYVPEQGKYLYYQPVYFTKQRCVTCHKLSWAKSGSQLGGADLSISAGNPRPPIRLGDLVAVVKVEIPTGPTLRAINLNRALLLATAIITVFLAMIASYVIVRYVIVKPLKHLRDVSDAISQGNIEKRAEIHTGDEFEGLGTAFNRMLRHLVEAHAELRHVNTDLDHKVDQLAQMNMRLYEMNRLKGDFLATMSHELRTPLNSIIGFSDVLGSISSLDDKQKRYVQNIQKSGKMLLDMINDILDLAKIESGKMELRPSQFHISHVIGGLCDMCRPLTERKNIDLECDIQSDLPELYQDQGKVQQILNNLLSNAIKFTPEGGRIVVRAHRDDKRRLVLVVEDTGVGIAEGDQTNIFEKFRQGNVVLPAGDAMTREYSGTGLGLSIVKELCRLLEGEIWLESQLGKGSTFVVVLPWELVDVPRSDSVLAEQMGELTKPRRSEFAAAK